MKTTEFNCMIAGLQTLKILKRLTITDTDNL